MYGLSASLLLWTISQYVFESLPGGLVVRIQRSHQYVFDYLEAPKESSRADSPTHSPTHSPTISKDCILLLVPLSLTLFVF